MWVVFLRICFIALMIIIYFLCVQVFVRGCRSLL